ncbi:cupin domain-containing protein [Agrobacterium tumefaciens]|uniref:cupin domain-containing protein n=1 Tax=Agrobacterium tumefaciens TaxID=358 RepID=UPI0012B8F721|nr:cupin domain-containing protein [Agrobacterium tumefaciens]MQB04467.1 cupin domain-containing protein [Agrobacterium tumefaciens]
MNREEIIIRLGLSRHLEGGYFSETYRSDGRNELDTPRGRRAAVSAIQYMLTDDSPVDVFHSKHSDGLTFFHLGSPITYHLIYEDGSYHKVVLGPDLSAGHRLQLFVPGGTWKAAELEAGTFGLVSDVAAPGWDMSDMCLALRGELLEKFPQHAEVITRLGLVQW